MTDTLGGIVSQLSEKSKTQHEVIKILDLDLLRIKKIVVILTARSNSLIPWRSFFLEM